MFDEVNLKNLLVERPGKNLRRDRRYPEKEGWELHLTPDGTQIYFNVHSNQIRVTLRGG